MKPSELEVGMSVKTSGYSGTIIEICKWSRSGSGENAGVMVEVMLVSGLVCVSCHDLTQILTIDNPCAKFPDSQIDVEALI